jgi:uncharacterized protein (AIM24 family)
MKCHEVDYEIFGDDMQTVEVELDPGETVIAEAGAMNWMEDGIGFEANINPAIKYPKFVIPAKAGIQETLDAGSSPA